MTIDERIEALTMSLELLTRDVQDMRAESQQMRADYEQRSAATDRRLSEVMEAINTLGRIAGLHQERLDEHGQRLEDLEDR